MTTEIRTADVNLSIPTITRPSIDSTADETKPGLMMITHRD